MGTELRINKFIKQFLENCTVAALNSSLKHSVRTEGKMKYLLFCIFLQDFNQLQVGVDSANKSVFLVK